MYWATFWAIFSQNHLAALAELHIADFHFATPTKGGKDILPTFYYPINYLKPAVGYLGLRRAFRKGQYYKTAWTICLFDNMSVFHMWKS
jgi:hypothetical protein